MWGRWLRIQCGGVLSQQMLQAATATTKNDAASLHAVQVRRNLLQQSKNVERQRVP
jgi:hypothetical protein